MTATDQVPDAFAVPAPVPVPRPIDRALRGLTKSANHGVIWFGIAAVGALAGGRSRRAALRGVGSLAMGSFVSNSVIKPLVGRRRPDPARTKLARKIHRQPWTSSFPSGHSASAAAFAVGASLELPAAAAILGPLAAAVAYSRVHVGVHYRSDVAAGVAVGAAVALAGKRLWPVKPWGAVDMIDGTAPALPRGDGLTIVLNEGSGTSAGAEQALATALPQARIVVWDPDGPPLAELIGEPGRALGVAGGDGTVASVAALAHDLGLPLAVFPFGTLNHFAGALGLNSDAAAVAAVESGTAGEVDVAMINDSLFLNTASLGGYPEMVLRRDKLTHRMGKWPATAYALIRTVRHHQPLDLTIDGRRIPVWVVFVGNGRYRPRGLAPAWRDNLAGRVLDVQYLRADRRLARTRGVLYSLLGLVERSTVFEVLDLAEVTISSDSGPLPPAHDGEIGDPVTQARFHIHPDRLTVYRG